ncbi:hypothetical protein [Deinococcus yavapaiensis]|uniref:Uncharacterized protein n=1 Tax=Deinococcus yavapaiensis KR-236 TaxID=694435 RepID=A0A318S2D7_9DEIO|nr:hypothetical protein [Deinococcus yavapaiensis]PYE49906.1 hypothetical protein DES52_12138 [Deinococcus yavapaiensis KR-236]
MKRAAVLLGALLLGGAVFVLGGPRAALQRQLGATTLRSEADDVTEQRRLDLSDMRWTSDETRFTFPSDARREEVTAAYRQALVELSYALYTADATGLGSYFREGALTDARRAVSSGERQQFVTWNHALTLRFYAPKGNIASFTDRACYAQWSGATPRPLSGRRESDVVMRLGDDGVWRVDQWQVRRDTPLDLPSGQVTPDTVRGAPCPP